MSQNQQSTIRNSNRPLARVYEPTRSQSDSYSGALSPTGVTVTQFVFGSSPAESTDSFESDPSAEEAQLLREKEALTKAVEALRLRRQAITEARRKTEEEVQRLAREEEARDRATAAALQSSEAKRRRLETEEIALRQVTQDLAQRRVLVQTARAAAPSETPRVEESKTPMRLHERLHELAVQERLKTEQQDTGAAVDRLRIERPLPLRSQALSATDAQASLEQRLRAEIEGMAAAQRKNVDAARAQVSMRRTHDPAQTATAL